MKRASPWKRYRNEFVRIVHDLRNRHTDVDRIPYTPVFDDVYSDFVSRVGVEIPRGEFFWELVVVRKNFKKFAAEFLSA